MLLACSTGMAQIMTSFSIGAMGTSLGSFTSTGGSAILFEGKAKCMTLATGVSALAVAENATGIFNETCKETPPVAEPIIPSFSVNKFSLTVYPNPTSGMSMLKCDGQFDQGLSCMVRVIGLNGKVMMNQAVAMSALKSGFMINASEYAAGTYMVVAELMGQRYTQRLIRL